MTPITRSAADEIMRSRGWLPMVPEPFRTEVLQGATLQHFSAGEPIFHLGDPMGGLYGLVRGTVSVSIATAGTNPRLVILGAPGSWTGEACFLTRRPRRGDLTAVVETSMLHLPLETLDRMSARDPNVVHHVAQILMMSVDYLLRVIHDLQSPEADRRIASVLQRTAFIGTCPIPLTQSEVGTMANASRKQVNAALKRFSAAGWVRNAYRSIIITDAPALSRFADGRETD